MSVLPAQSRWCVFMPRPNRRKWPSLLEFGRKLVDPDGLLPVYSFTKLLSSVFFPRTIYGQEHIPLKGPVIFASNHVSNLDPWFWAYPRAAVEFYGQALVV